MHRLTPAEQDDGGLTPPLIVSRERLKSGGGLWSLLVDGREVKVRTDHWLKPIPTKNFDWSAWFDDDEPDDLGHMTVGYGATEEDAIDELLEAADFAAS